MNVKDIDLNIGEDFGIVYAVQDDNVDLTGSSQYSPYESEQAVRLLLKCKG